MIQLIAGLLIGGLIAMLISDMYVMLYKKKLVRRSIDGSVERIDGKFYYIIHETRYVRMLMKEMEDE